MILVRLDNGRIIVKNKDRQDIRYIPWNCIDLGKIVDPNQVYYHLGKLLSTYPKTSLIQVFMPNPKIYSFSYPHQNLKLSECKRIEAHREKEKGLDPKIWRKQVLLGSKRHLVYYDRQTMEVLDHIFQKLGRNYEPIPWMNQTQVQVFCSPEYVYAYKPSNEDALSFTFSTEGVRFFQDLDMDPELAYKYLGKSISLDEDEKLDHFLTLFYLEQFSNIHEYLRGVPSLAMDQGRYKDDFSRLYKGDFEEINYEDRSLRPQSDLKTGIRPLANFSFKLAKNNLAYGLVLGLLIFAMAGHYFSLTKDLATAKKSPKLEVKKSQVYGRLFKSLNLGQVESYEFTYDENQARLKAQAGSLEEVHFLKKKLEEEGHQLKHEDIQFQDGHYRVDWTIE